MLPLCLSISLETFHEAIRFASKKSWEDDKEHCHSIKKNFSFPKSCYLDQKEWWAGFSCAILHSLKKRWLSLIAQNVDLRNVQNKLSSYKLTRILWNLKEQSKMCTFLFRKICSFVLKTEYIRSLFSPFKAKFLYVVH